MPESKGKRPRLVIILGPTAVGKSAIGLEMAIRFGGEIISADSMQVYRYLDIGTAKPTTEQRKVVQHHLIDIVEPDEEFSAALFLKLASIEIKELNKKNKSILIVGGTGLYLKVLTEGLLSGPQPDRDLRERLRCGLDRFGKFYLHDLLNELDNASAQKINPNDIPRTIRALEAVMLTGESIRDMQQRHAFGERNYEYLKIGLRLKRPELYKKIERRSEEMFENGLVEETENILARGYREDLKALQSLGYKHIIKYLKGAIGLKDALDNIKRDTRHYAKRQFTWFARDREIEWFNPGQTGEIRARIEEFLAG